MADVAIVGGGILGLLAARELSRRGRDVVLLDDAPSRPPASWAGGGILSPLFPWRFPDAVTALAQGVNACYRALSEEVLAAGGQDPEVTRHGMLVLDEPDWQGAADWARRHNQALEEVDASRIEPGLPEGPALWLPDVATVWNPRLLQGLERLLSSDPHVAMLRERALHLERQGHGWQLLGESSRLAAKQVLVAAGAWSAELLEPLGVALPLMPVQGEMLRYAPGSSVPGCVVLSSRGYLVPRADGSLLVGSTLREGVDDMRPSEKGHDYLRTVAATLWPALGDRQPALQWAGIRPGNRAAAPFIGEVPGHAGLFLATGHYRNGLTCAPGSASLVAALLCDEPPPIDPAAYAPGSSRSSSSFLSR